MSRKIDTALALRLVSMIIKPFDETDAYKLGIINSSGKNLIPSDKFTTSEQKDAYTVLDKLVFNIKKILAKFPGGDNKLKNVISAAYLIKESYDNGEDITEESFMAINENITDILSDKEYSLLEDGIAANNASSGGVSGFTKDDVAVKVNKKKKASEILKRYSKQNTIPVI